MIAAPVATLLSVAGSASLAFWLVVVQPRFGPQSLRSSLLACAIALALLHVVERSAVGLADTTDIAVTLLCLVVPSFGFAFWSGGVLLRAFVAGPDRLGR